MPGHVPRERAALLGDALCVFGGRFPPALETEADVFHPGRLALGTAAGSGHRARAEGSPCQPCTGCGRSWAQLGTAGHGSLPRRGQRGRGERGGGCSEGKRVSGRRCHCRGIRPGRRRGEREGGGEPGPLARGDSPRVPHTARRSLQPAPAPSPPPLFPQGADPPLPLPGFQGNPDVWARLRRCSAGLRCQMFPLPPGRVCAPRPGTPPRGRGSPRASTSGGGGFTPTPCNTRGTGGILLLTQGLSASFWGHCIPVNPGKCGIRGCGVSGSPGALQAGASRLVVASLGLSLSSWEMGPEEGSGRCGGSRHLCQEVMGSGMFDPRGRSGAVQTNSRCTAGRSLGRAGQRPRGTEGHLPAPVVAAGGAQGEGALREWGQGTD